MREIEAILQIGPIVYRKDISKLKTGIQYKKSNGVGGKEFLEIISKKSRSPPDDLQIFTNEGSPLESPFK